MSGDTVVASAWRASAQPRTSLVAGAQLVALHSIVESRGQLDVAQVGRELPFPVRRIFMISHVPRQDVRGEHAHRELHQFLICAHGQVTVEVSDGRSSRVVVLDSSDVGLHIAPMVWASQHSYSADAILVVLASAEYDAADYIRSHDDYLAARRVAT